jgi:Na+/phosphate symporter
VTDGSGSRRPLQHECVLDAPDRAVTAVGAGALPIRGAIPIILGANVGTTVTTTLVALTFIGSRTEFRRALAASTIHDFYICSRC